MSKSTRPSHQNVNGTVASRLLGCDRAHVTHEVNRGKFPGSSRAKNGELMIPVAAIEARLGRPVTDEELRAAQAKNPRECHGHPRTVAQAVQEFKDRVALASMDPGVAAFYAERRDIEWDRHLQARGVTVPSPGPFEYAQPVLDLQNFFTRAQVEQLIVNALEQRDREWRDWANSGVVDQALNPHGPLSVSQKPL